MKAAGVLRPSPIPYWEHQKEDFARSKDLSAAAIHWEPRLGKSRLIIDTAVHLAGECLINACLVIAPNGVHLNWTRDQLPLYWDSFFERTRIVEWKAGRVGTKSFTKELDEALQYPGFVWLACNVEAVATVNLNRYLTKFVNKRKVLLAVDESQYVKNPRAKRTRALMRLSEKCPFRRTLTGTPTPQGPFDLWSQFYILDPNILGLRYTSFKQRYGVWRRVHFGTGPAFDQLVEYRNLDNLTARIAPITFERKKAECLDLPERLFTKRLFELPPAHARIYNSLKSCFIALLDSGEEITAPLALTNLLRLQQVSRGHVIDDSGNRQDLGEPYPSVEAVLELLRAHRGKAIIWCRFVRDVEMVAAALMEEFTPPAVAVCVGGTAAADRVDLRTRFSADPMPRFWVGTLATGGVGVDLGAASLMIFYSHGFDLAQRLQGCERNFGSSQKADRVDVVDLVAADTVDEKAIAALQRKEALSAQLSTARLRDLLK